MTMNHLRLADIIDQPKINETVTVKGWVRTFRANRFIALNDGSTIDNLQCVVDYENTDAQLLKKLIPVQQLKLQVNWLKVWAKDNL